MPKESIDMAEVLKRSPEKTIIIMTCAGEPIGNLDATHRLLVYAKIEK
jgi:sortase (surface protein transpeptidase)